jgi:altronate dehydratase small subunit
LSQDIPFGHKFSTKDIQKGEPVIKYGEIIGKAITNISKGGHVHVHNVEGLKGRGDKQ